MPDLTPQQLAALQAQVDTDPRAQQARLRYSNSRVSSISLKDVIGMDVPGYTFEPRTGKVTKVTNFPKEQLIPWGALATGGALGLLTASAAPAALAPAAAPAAAAPAVAAPAAAGTGALETAGTVNLGTQLATDVPAATSGFNWSSLLRYLPAAGSKAIDALLQNRQSNQRLEAERARQAVAESTLDPFRGYMDQAHDAGRLDWMANQDLKTPPLQLDPKYGAGLTPPPTRDYGPSADTRALLRAASSQVAAGDTAPLITPGAQPLPVIKRKKNPNPDDPNSWLYQS